MSDKKESESENKKPAAANLLISAKTVVLVERIKLLKAAQAKQEKQEVTKE